VFDTLESVAVPSDPTVLADRVLRLVASRAETFSTSVKLEHSAAIDLFLPADNDLLLFLRELESQGLVKSGQQSPFWVGHVTFKGWERLRTLEKQVPSGNRAFVAMWFTEELKPVWSEGIKPALVTTGYDPVRVDELEHNGRIDDRIMAELREASLVLADFTGHRPSVYFEAGFAMGRQVPVIWLCRKDQIKDAHFDTRQYNHISWESAQELRIKLEARIRATVPTPSHRRADA
jgi:hypothetical protein